VRIRIWGTRASIPTPGTTDFCTTRYGGNTTCLTVSIPGTLVIVDAGSGVRHLGLALDAMRPTRASFFFSHLHWDHIQGFPFFAPLYREGNVFSLYGSHPGATNALQRALSIQQDAIYFPVGLEQMPARLTFHDLNASQTVELAGRTARLRITPFVLNHPGSCFGFRIEEHVDGKRTAVAVFASDTEPLANGKLQLTEAAREADMLIHDAQYAPEEYSGENGVNRKGWGHSTWKEALREAEEAGVKRLLLSHHDPQHDDWEIARLAAEARAEGGPKGIDVEAAREGMEIDL
jgi:phosphoribosyl 1,2-cyclic phosphodiesterase